MNTIAAEWERYAASVLPASAPEIQRIECRRAFYAGAMSTLAIVEGLGEDHVSEDAGIAILNGLKDESERFVAQIHAGQA